MKKLQEEQSKPDKPSVKKPEPSGPAPKAPPKTGTFQAARVEESQLFQKPNLSKTEQDSFQRAAEDSRSDGRAAVRFEKIEISNWDDDPRPSLRDRNGYQQPVHRSRHLHPPPQDFEYVQKTPPLQRLHPLADDRDAPRSHHSRNISRHRSPQHDEPPRNLRQHEIRANNQNWGSRAQKTNDWRRKNPEGDYRFGYRDSTIADIKRDKKLELKSVYKLLSQTVQSRKLPFTEDRGPDSLPADKMATILQEFEDRMRSFGFKEDHKESNVLEEHKNYGNYFQKKKQNLIDNFRVFDKMHRDFTFPSHLQRKNNYRQYCAELPIYAKKIEFIKAIQKKRVVIFKSNPGSGKSTQLPQFLLDCIEGRVLVTEPRVIAVEGVARRVIEVRTDNRRRCPWSTTDAEKTSRRSSATSEALSTTSTRRTSESST